MTIGTGAIIGAGTVVTHDVPPYAVVVQGAYGSRIVKYRFSDEIISDLLESRWWQYNFPAMLSRGDRIPYRNVKDFLSYIRNTEREKLIPVPDDVLVLYMDTDNNVHAELQPDTVR